MDMLKLLYFKYMQLTNFLNSYILFGIYYSLFGFKFHTKYLLIIKVNEVYVSSSLVLPGFSSENSVH